MQQIDFIFMIKDEIISLSTAKLAKLLGFNLQSYHWYGCDNPSGNTVPNKLMFTPFEHKVIGTLNSQEGTHIYLAPTQTILHRWLRELYKCRIEVCEGDEHFYVKYGLSIEDILYQEVEILEGKKLRFRTFEEALEHGLNKCISRLLKIKNKE